jgi:hypothetical protein
MRATKKVLIQSLVTRTSCRKLDALAKTRGCSRSAYLERLVSMHVRAVTPRLLRALDEASPQPRRQP